MSSLETNKSREDVLAARAKKKLAKQKNKSIDVGNHVTKEEKQVSENKEIINKVSNSVLAKNNIVVGDITIVNEKSPKVKIINASQSQINISNSPVCKDEVDRAGYQIQSLLELSKSNDTIKVEKATKKAAKHAKKLGVTIDNKDVTVNDMTVKDVVETLKDIANVAKEMKEVTAKVQAIDFEGHKSTDTSKSKAELRAERRAKQEAQRAAKQDVLKQKTVIKSEPTTKHTVPSTKASENTTANEEKKSKLKVVDKSKAKLHSVHRVNWFQHLHTGNDKEKLNTIALNSNLHPAIVKLGVQLASRVVTGSNARCIALLDALKKMVRDYSLPAKTEFARGLESHLTASLDFLWTMRQPSASQTNAVKFFRHHITQLPNNVDEFDAKKTLQEEIDRYIREQIGMAGEAISMTVRKKISTGDSILTYGCSSLIERILREAWEAEVYFQAVVVGNRVDNSAKEMLRRLVSHGVPSTYVDITALSFVMKNVNKVLLGASSLLVNGSVLSAMGTAQVALMAKAANVPVLVACETHKFSERVQTDAFVYNEIGDPDDLIDKSDENSPLKDWRLNPNLTPLNLTYDVTPPSLVTAVVTELAILPCTSAPVVLRFKLSEYGI